VTADQRYQEVVARAWSDASFKSRLLAHPAEVLGEYGFTLPPGTGCRVVEDTKSIRHLVLPSSPEPGALSDDQLDEVAGGQGNGVTLSSNVVNAFKQINEAGALQFDVPAYAARNMPLPEVYPAAWYPGPTPGMPNY
jgi:hypothetical protein